ncbi:unnamed protein product [Heligmosomoides polygyrus]|uniref:Secreted protein n=1 Tax=Heligmosomoides polygyrus TaxID=6339 RepID=A0A183GVL0_HELPZ|nr:unnamed protein product [Heligmosomoides polygyrus]
MRQIWRTHTSEAALNSSANSTALTALTFTLGPAGSDSLRWLIRFTRCRSISRRRDCSLITDEVPKKLLLYIARTESGRRIKEHAPTDSTTQVEKI